MKEALQLSSSGSAGLNISGHNQFSLWVSLLCCCSVMQSCLTVCNPMDCSTPGFPVLHYLSELAQIHVHLVGDAIQPSHPPSPPSAPALSLSQHQGLRIRLPKYWSFSFSISPSSEYSRLISFRTDWFNLCFISLQTFFSKPHYT